MRCYDVNFVDDHICKSDPSQKVLDSWVRIKTALAECQKPPTNIARDEILLYCRCGGELKEYLTSFICRKCHISYPISKTSPVA